ncbi:MAG: ATP-binding protein [Chloroflexaceae bacterium]|nr:ATP-binding protein [Chloroflexaceae bacterium]
MQQLRLDFGDNRLAAQLTMSREPDLPLNDFLARFPARPAEPIPPSWMAVPIGSLHITPVSLASAQAETPPAARHLRQVLDQVHTEENAQESVAHTNGITPQSIAPAVVNEHWVTTLTDSEAVGRAYAQEIAKIGRYLSNDLSVLVLCDKVLVEHLYRHAVKHSNKRPLLEVDAITQAAEPAANGLGSQSDTVTAAARVAAIGRLLTTIKVDQVLVLRHLDMLAGTTTAGSLTTEARMLTEVLYRSHDWMPTLLAFSDPSLVLPRVITDRFAIHVELAGLSHNTINDLVTQAEHDRFERFDSDALFKNVSGLNAIQFRNAMRYLHASSQPGSPTPQLLQLIREFKRGNSEEIEIPETTFDEIGGYATVKQELFEAIELITGRRPPFYADGRPYTLRSADREIGAESTAARTRRRKLAPHGFIFYGPPGTGKTLFAKAIANAMNATIQMVSGPEIMDMWVGKSESNLRHIFAVARRNAPAVIFFDEFDSIAMRRSDSPDGGNRTSNAVVAQLLTELDGFHTDQDILVIGTTNRLDIIDEALLRPSRFQPIQIDLPDSAARRQIAAIHARAFELDLPEKQLLDVIVEQTEGFNGDELRAIFQQVAREVRRQQTITTATFLNQIDLIRHRREEHQHSHER